MSDEPAGTTDVTDAEVRQRFEVAVDGDLAGFTVYRPHGRVYAFVHTEIDPAFEGKGLGSTLVRGAMDAMRERELGVLPFCPFVARFLKRHPEYAVLVPADRRAEFGLPSDGPPSHLTRAGE